MLPGSNRNLKDQAVLFTAHYDHFAFVPICQATIFSMALPTTPTGCGILLELARAFSVAKDHPGRSIIFAAVTAEEQGLLGSEYLGKHPPVPAGKITLDLNYDDVQPIGAPEEVEVSGAERTTFYPWVQATAKEFRLAIRPMLVPSRTLLSLRSFQSGSRPAFHPSRLMKVRSSKATTKPGGRRRIRNIPRSVITSPSDKYDPAMDFTGDAAMARFGFALGWEAASFSK